MKFLLLQLLIISTIQNLVNADSSVLKDAFFGDTPYLFYCIKDSKHSTVKDTTPHQIFTDLNLLKRNSMNFALVNCSSIGSSGKTLYQRFKINREIKPTIFGTAPWLKTPKQVPRESMKDVGTLSKYIDNSFAAKAVEVYTDKDLQASCDFNKKKDPDVDYSYDTCLVMVKGSRFGKSHMESEEKLVKQNARRKFITIDGTKRRLSFEDIDAMPANHFAMKLHAIRNGTHYMSMTNPSTYDYLSTFISHSLSAPISQYNHQDKYAIITINKTQKSAFKNRNQNFDNYNSNSNSKKSKNKNDDSNVNNDKDQDTIEKEIEEVKRRNREKERLRREKLEREAQENLYGDGSDSGSSNEEEDEEEIIEL